MTGPREVTPSAVRLVEAAKAAWVEIGEAVLDLARIERRLAAARSQLGYAVTMYDSGAVVELPDDDSPHDPRD